MMTVRLHRPFNSRPHKEVDTTEYTRCYESGSFNSRPHKEVDRSILMTASSRTPFNSRPHKEVDYDLLFLVKGTPTFQFTTSQGGRLRLKLSFLLAAKLSIHDLTRRSTAWGYHGKARGVLSIHDLTRRSTNTKQELSDGEALSIHDLTRRSTILARCVMVNLPFQFTTSQGGRRGHIIGER